ncbi:MAG: rhodanese-like domain-containing protein [Alphaproteobacteria bacterium]
MEEFKEALPTKAEELHLKGFQDLIKQGPVVVLDVRSKESFARRHLKGSVNAPLTDLTEKTLPQLVPDKNTPVVLACDYSFMPVRMLAMTIQAFPVLKANGYTKIYRLNLWSNPQGGDMEDYAAQEKALEFEGPDVTPATPK